MISALEEPEQTSLLYHAKILKKGLEAKGRKSVKKLREVIIMFVL